MNSSTIVNQPVPTPVAEAVQAATPSFTFGAFHPYDSQIEQPEIEGTRVVKCLYQVNGKTGKKVKESAYTRVPTDHITGDVINDNLPDLTPYIITWLQGVEDMQIKADHRTGLTSVFCDGLSIERLMAYLDELDLGGRLNKVMIEEWYDSEIAPTLMVLFAAKIGLDLEGDSAIEDVALVAKLEAILIAYKGKFSALASGKTSMKEEDCIAMIGVINSVDSVVGGVSSKMTMKLLVKLEKMQNKEEDLLISL